MHNESFMLQKIDNNKIIPIIRQNGEQQRPTFLKTKMFIDFSNDEDAEYNFDDLLRSLLNAPLYVKPDIRSNPFTPMDESRPDRAADGIISVMQAIATTYDATHTKYIFFSELIKYTGLHRLTLDRFLADAITEGLVTRKDDVLYITDKGRNYIFSHNIVEV